MPIKQLLRAINQLYAEKMMLSKETISLRLQSLSAFTYDSYITIRHELAFLSCFTLSCLIRFNFFNGLELYIVVVMVKSCCHLIDTLNAVLLTYLLPAFSLQNVILSELLICHRIIASLAAKDCVCVLVLVLVV